MKTIADFTAKLPGGGELNLADKAGNVLLIVNTASKCGFTPQYEGLEKLYKKYADDGFEVIAFPCNQFGAQEPGDAAQIGAFCQKNYGVTFPMFAKVDVKGPSAHQLFQYLTQAKRGILGTEAIKWNFTKFLIDRNGDPVARYAPQTKPEELEMPISKLL